MKRQPLRQTGIVEQLTERVCERSMFVRTGKQSRLAMPHKFGNSARGVCDDGCPGGKGLHNYARGSFCRTRRDRQNVDLMQRRGYIVRPSPEFNGAFPSYSPNLLFIGIVAEHRSTENQEP